MKIIESLR